MAEKPSEFKKLPLKTQKRTSKDIELRRQVDLEVKSRDKETNKLKELRKAIETRIMKVITRDKGGVHSVTLDGYETYASKVPVYSLKSGTGRIKLDDWVVYPLVEAGVEHEVIQDVIQRLAIFKNDPVKSTVEQYRLDTGGKLVPVNKDTSELIGGSLPGGIVMNYRSGVGFRKSTTK